MKILTENKFNKSTGRRPWALQKKMGPITITGSIVTIALIVLAVFLSANALLGQPVLTDHKIHIMATGSWEGNFFWDEEGRGGIPALYSYIRQKKSLLPSGRASLYFFHMNNLSGTTNPQDFKRLFFSENFDLFRYLSFDAISLSAQENDYLSQISSEIDLEHLPTVNFSYQPPGNSDAANPVKKFRLITKNNYHIYVSTLETGEEKGSELASLAENIQNHKEVDGIVLFLKKKEDERRENIEPKIIPAGYASPDNSEYRYFFAQKMENSSVTPAEFEENHLLEKLFRTGQKNRTTEKMNNLAKIPILIFDSESSSNTIQRLASNLFIFRMKKRTLCEIEIRFRAHQFVSITQRFVDVNGNNFPGRWVEGDNILKEALKFLSFGSEFKGD